MTERDQYGYWVGDFGGHLWKDDRGPESHCGRCGLVYARWSGDACSHAVVEARESSKAAMVDFLRAQLDERESEAQSRIHDVAQFSQAELDPDTLLREVEAQREVVDRFEAARARASASWENYVAWTNNEPEPHPALPEGPDENVIPGLEVAVRLLSAAHRDRPGYRAEWAV